MMNISVTPRAVLALLTLVVAQTFRAAIGFVPHFCGPNRGFGIPRSSQAVGQEPLPPKDETFNPFSGAREVLHGLDIPEDANRYDKVGNANGGIWRSRVFGFLPTTVVAAQRGTKWLTKEEAAGNVYQSWMKSVVQLLAGKKSISTLGTQEEAHAIGRRVFSEALSAKAILKLKPILESALEKVVLRWEEYAKTGQEVEVQDDITDFTLESIAAGLFGEYATPSFMKDTKRLLPALLTGLFSFPYRFPPPLNKLPTFAFGSSMDARQEYKDVVRDLIQRRRADVAAGMGASNSGGLLDSFFELQKQYQMDAKAGSFSFDDDFIIDNVINILFAGKDTTSVTLTRMLQLLGTAEDGKEIMDQLIDELSKAATVDDGEREDGTAAGLPGAGLFTSCPLLNAVVLEANRLHRSVGAVFRTTRKDISYNGYLIPEGETMIIAGISTRVHSPRPSTRSQGSSVRSVSCMEAKRRIQTARPRLVRVPGPQGSRSLRCGASGSTCAPAESWRNSRWCCS
ncbi:unnamed protein product [Ectocarpus sp. 6 AP-2014]